MRGNRGLVAVLLALALVPAARAAGPADGSPQPLVNSLGMVFVAVPAGEFGMGHQESAASWARDFPGYPVERFAELTDESPVHTVRITRPFHLGKHEVTVGQFRLFLARSGYVPESVRDGTGAYGYNPAYNRARGGQGEAFQGRDLRYSWAEPGFAQTEAHPVVNVTWNDAVAMADWLSRTEGRRYRLPTEAEWEYACRAGSRTRYSHGDDPQRLPEVANVFDADAAVHWPWWAGFALRGSDGHAFTAPVGQFKPNAWGLHDMMGNVWEWVADWHADDYYSSSPAADPQGPTEGTVKVRRGGSWHTWSLYNRCSYRNWNSPTTRYTLVGFRLLLEAP